MAATRTKARRRTGLGILAGIIVAITAGRADASIIDLGHPSLLPEQRHAARAAERGRADVPGS